MRPKIQRLVTILLFSIFQPHRLIIGENDNFYRFVITIFIFQLSPMYWVSKWVDYSDKYGFGYALCDESIGVVFNDLTKLLLLSDGR